MNNHQSSLSQPSRTFDPTQQAPGHIQNLVSNALIGEQNVLLREFRYTCHNTDLLPPALTEDTLVVVTEGQCDLQGRIVQPFHHSATVPN
jgi:hypothetical protein